MKAAIIVDSTAYLSAELTQDSDVYQVYLSVNFDDGSTYPDSNQPALIEMFYQRLTEAKSLPTTSQPQIGEYYSTVEHLIDQNYDTVFCIHLSSAISGTFQQAQMLAKEFSDKIKMYCIDSKGSSVVLESLVCQTLELIRAGIDPQQINTLINQVANDAEIYLMVEDLNHLSKGGRLSSTSAFFGSIIQIKPLLYFDKEGKIVLFEKHRGVKKVYRRWEELALDFAKRYPQGMTVAFAHTRAEQEIYEVMEKIKVCLDDDVDYFISEIGPVVGTHLGTGAKGMALIPKVIF